MKRNNILKLTIIAILLIFAKTEAQCTDIVYPSKDLVTINADKTFFIGHETSAHELTVNGEPVKIHESGSFKHFVKLEEGKNIFHIKSGKKIKKYTIIRPKISSEHIEPVYKPYEKEVYLVTKREHTPLRSTPVDEGLNRLEHYEKDIPFTAIGEYGNFYKVKLARDDYAWISKNFTKVINTNNIAKAKILSYTYNELPNKREFILKLNHKTPYVLYENHGLDLTIYNVENFPLNRYEFHINQIHTPFGYSAKFNNNNELIVEVKNPPQIDKNNKFKNIKITIDPGHGGNEIGTVSCLGDKEKDINLAIANILKEKLNNMGANVIMTRDTDKEVSLLDRVEIANKNNSDIFISIHNNALPDSLADKNISGTEVYYFYPQSKKLANDVLDNICKCAETNRLKAQAQSFAVVRNTNCPSILIEIGYMIDPEESTKIRSQEFQQKAAQGIINGLEKYLNELQ